MNNSARVWLLAICFVLLSQPAVLAKVVNLDNKEHRDYKGVLGDQDQYTFSIKTGEAVSISIDQINADVKIALSRVTKKRKSHVYELSTSAATWLNELLYITSEECTVCEVTVLPQNNIDQSGVYKLTFQKKKTIDPLEKSIMQLATEAAISWQKANLATGQSIQYLNKAASLYQRAINLSETYKNQSLHIRQLYHASQIALLESNYQGLKQHTTHILSHQKGLSNQMRLRTKYSLAEYALSEWKLDSAKPILHELITTAQAENDQLMNAAAHSLLGFIYSQEASFEQAFKLQKYALEIYESAGDWKGIIDTNLALGDIYKGLGDIDQSIKYFLIAESIANTTQATEKKIETNIVLAISHRVLGNFDKANYHIELALQNFQQLPRNTTFNLLKGAAKQQKARILMALGQLEYAADVFSEAYLSYKNANSNADMINIDYYLGIIFGQLKNFKRAKQHALKVLDNDKKTGVAYDIGTAYHRLAGIYLGLEEYAEAHNLQTLAIESLVKIEDKQLLGNVYAQAGEIAYHNGLTALGLEYFTLARKAHKKTQSLLETINTEYRFAKVQTLYGDPSSILNSLSQTLHSIDKVQRSILQPDQRRSFLALQQNLTSLYIQAQHLVGKSPLEMLNVAEQFRTQTLQQTQQISKLKHSSLDTEYVAKRDNINLQIQQQIYEYQQLSDSELRQSIIYKTRTLTSQLQALNTKKDTKKQLKNPQKLAQLNLEEVQQNLPQDTLVLYFDTAESQSHFWALSQTNVKHFIIPDEKTITQKVNDLFAEIEKQTQHKRVKNQGAFNALSQTLFNNTDILWHNYQHIVVVPDGNLHAVPFSALSPTLTALPLVETHTLSYVPSLQTYQYLQSLTTNTDSDNAVLLVANPSLKTINNVSPTSTENLTSQHVELPYTQYEAEVITPIINSNSIILLREQASKQNVISQLSKNFNVIHFATHGVSHTYAQSLAGLVLSNNQSNNNLLLATEISQLDVTANMVILSGCETAKGKLLNGEGLMGLSRAFFEAGTKSVVASLWPVQDKATAELMKHFYRQMFAEYQSPKVALRKAKLKIKNYRKKNGHMPWRAPYYWAGFVLQGSGGDQI